MYYFLNIVCYESVFFLSVLFSFCFSVEDLSCSAELFGTEQSPGQEGIFQTTIKMDLEDQTGIVFGLTIYVT